MRRRDYESAARRREMEDDERHRMLENADDGFLAALAEGGRGPVERFLERLAERPVPLEREVSKKEVENRGFAFDGNCEASKGADLTLKLQDDQELKAHSSLLRITSTVLATAIDECKSEGYLELKSDSAKAWRLLLNVIHPVGAFFYDIGHEDVPLEELEEIARIARKYEFKTVHTFVDRSIERLIRQKSATIRQSKGGDELKSAVTADKNILALLSMVAKYDMESSTKACADYIAKCFVSSDRVSTGSYLGPSSAGPAIANVLTELSNEGCSKAACSVAAAVIRLFSLS